MSVSSPEPLHKKHSLSPSHQSTRNAQKQRSRVDATWREANPFTASPTSRGINTRLSSHIREIWSELTCRFFGASRINTAASTPQSRITLPEKRFRAGRKESIARDTHKKTLRLLSTGVACSFFFLPTGQCYKSIPFSRRVWRKQSSRHSSAVKSKLAMAGSTRHIQSAVNKPVERRLQLRIGKMQYQGSW